MKRIDLSPLYSNSVGFDRFATILDHALSNESSSAGYPPYNIEETDTNRYAITLDVAGFSEQDLSLNVEKGVLTVHGKKEEKVQKTFLHQGIANRSFERKFNLADHIEITGAELHDGLLTIHLLREIPEAMKPRNIEITRPEKALQSDHTNVHKVA